MALPAVADVAVATVNTAVAAVVGGVAGGGRNPCASPSDRHSCKRHHGSVSDEAAPGVAEGGVAPGGWLLPDGLLPPRAAPVGGTS